MRQKNNERIKFFLHPIPKHSMFSPAAWIQPFSASTSADLNASSEKGIEQMRPLLTAKWLILPLSLTLGQLFDLLTACLKPEWTWREREILSSSTGHADNGFMSDSLSGSERFLFGFCDSKVQNSFIWIARLFTGIPLCFCQIWRSFPFTVLGVSVCFDWLDTTWRIQTRWRHASIGQLEHLSTLKCHLNIISFFELRFFID